MFDEPINVNLIMSANLNSNDKIGGNPDQIIDRMNNKYYTNMIYHSGPNINFINKNPELKKLKFKFNDELNTKNTPNSKYLGKGGVTAVFSIMLDNSSEIDNDNEFQQIQKHLPSQMLEQKNLVMRVEYDDCMDFNHFLDVWKRDKKLFPSNIIDVYAYGFILDYDETLLGKYIITKKYYDYKQIIQLDYNSTVQLTQSMCNFLIQLKNHKIYYRDLKIQNIGYDYVGPNMNQMVFVVLDYDTNTLLRSDDIFFYLPHIKYCSESCAGTYIPYYVMNNYISKETYWKDELDKLYSLGLFNVLLILYYDNNPSIYAGNNKRSQHIANLLTILKYIETDFSYNDTDEIYSNMISKYNDEFHVIKDIIKTLIPKYNEIDSSTNQKLIKILINLLDINYFKIYHIDKIYEILSGVFEWKSRENSHNSNETNGYDSDNTGNTTDSSISQIYPPIQINTTVSSSDNFEDLNNLNNLNNSKKTSISSSNSGDGVEIYTEIDHFKNTPDKKPNSKSEQFYLKYLKYKKKYIELKKIEL